MRKTIITMKAALVLVMILVIISSNNIIGVCGAYEDMLCITGSSIDSNKDGNGNRLDVFNDIISSENNDTDKFNIFDDLVEDEDVEYDVEYYNIVGTGEYCDRDKLSKVSFDGSDEYYDMPLDFNALSSNGWMIYKSGNDNLAVLVNDKYTDSDGYYRAITVWGYEYLTDSLETITGIVLDFSDWGTQENVPIKICGITLGDSGEYVLDTLGIPTTVMYNYNTLGEKTSVTYIYRTDDVNRGIYLLINIDLDDGVRYIGYIYR